MVLCPNCWAEVSIEDILCRNCGERFQEHPEIRAKKREMRAEFKRGVGNIISIVTIASSMFLLIIIMMLDNLHRWIMPIERNELPYLSLMIFGILIALGLFVQKMRNRISLNPSNPRILVPYAIFAFSCIGMILILFAEEVDRFLTESTSALLPALMIVTALGIILLAFSKSARHKRKERILG